MTLFEDLKWRGLIKDISSPELEKKLNEEKLTFYIGTDPTADSMHIGHFSSFLIATRLAKYGHKPILLIGGATGLIGDPKPSTERQMITKEALIKQFNKIQKQYLEAVRLGNYKEIDRLAEERNYVVKQIRRLKWVQVES